MSDCDRPQKPQEFGLLGVASTGVDMASLDGS